MPQQSPYILSMDPLAEKLLELLQKIPKSYYLPILFGLMGFVFLVIGLIQLYSPKEQSILESITVQANLSPSLPFKQNTIQVDVEGAVVNPGVYSIAATSRMKDALIAAGGLSEEADRNYVAKQINLAIKAGDGAKLYIPKTGEIAKIEESTQGVNITTGLININTATADQLDNLPGIGQVTAQKIISARPFSSIEELLTKKVISNSVFQKIKDAVTIY